MSTWPWGDWGGQNSKGQNGEASSQPGPLLSSEPDKMLNGHTSTVWAVAFSPTGHRLASGSHDASIKLWDPEGAQCVATLTGHTEAVLSVAFSPVGHRLASGSADTTVMLWNPESGQCVGTLTGHTGAVWSLAFSPTGYRMASGSHDTTVRLWDPDALACVAVLTGHTETVMSVAFSPSGQRLASGSRDNTVKMWDLKDGQCVSTLTSHSSDVLAVAFSPSGHRLASGSLDATVKLWNPEDEMCVATLPCNVFLSTVAFAPPGQWLAVGGSSGSIQLWDMTPDFPSELFGLVTVIRAAAASTAVYPELGAALRELDTLVGLQSIKDQVAEIVNLKLEDPGYSMGHCNMRFVGPSGVGKTVVAKIVGRILSACGLVQLRGETPADIKCVEMRKASIIGEAVGTTSPKAEAFLEQHVGRVILFDEANSFGKGGEYAAEAASVINVFLDKYEGRVCMIVAGYDKDIKKNFLAVDEGLASRFAETLVFPENGYTAPELAQIFHLQLGKKSSTQATEWQMSVDCNTALITHLTENIAVFQHPNFMNGRGVETMVKLAARQQAKRQNREYHVLEEIDLVNALEVMDGGNPIHRHLIDPTGALLPTSGLDSDQVPQPFEGAPGQPAAASATQPRVPAGPGGMVLAVAVDARVDEIASMEARAAKAQIEQQQAAAEMAAVAQLEAAEAHAAEHAAEVNRLQAEAAAQVAAHAAAVQHLDELRLEERRRHRATLGVVGRAIEKLDTIVLAAHVAIAVVAVAVLALCIGLELAVAVAAVTATTAILFPDVARAVWTTLHAAISKMQQLLWALMWPLLVAVATWIIRWLGPQGRLLLIVLGVLAGGVALRLAVSFVTDPIMLCCVVTIGFGIAQLALCDWVRAELKEHHAAALARLGEGDE
eukprot:m.306762 g.306762  ORF g.306762 m.306762 type:complete len:890 (-) comp27369_c0_seq1:222-2891(-)